MASISNVALFGFILIFNVFCGIIVVGFPGILPALYEHGAYASECDATVKPPKPPSIHVISNSNEISLNSVTTPVFAHDHDVTKTNNTSFSSNIIPLGINATSTDHDSEKTVPKNSNVNINNTHAYVNPKNKSLETRSRRLALANNNSNGLIHDTFANIDNIRSSDKPLCKAQSLKLSLVFNIAMSILNGNTIFVALLSNSIGDARTVILGTFIAMGGVILFAFDYFISGWAILAAASCLVCFPFFSTPLLYFAEEPEKVTMAFSLLVAALDGSAIVPVTIGQLYQHTNLSWKYLWFGYLAVLLASLMAIPRFFEKKWADIFSKEVTASTETKKSLGISNSIDPDNSIDATQAPALAINVNANGSESEIEPLLGGLKLKRGHKTYASVDLESNNTKVTAGHGWINKSKERKNPIMKKESELLTRDVNEIGDHNQEFISDREEEAADENINDEVERQVQGDEGKDDEPYPTMWAAARSMRFVVFSLYIAFFMTSKFFYVQNFLMLALWSSHSALSQDDPGFHETSSINTLNTFFSFAVPAGLVCVPLVNAVINRGLLFSLVIQSLVSVAVAITASFQNLEMQYATAVLLVFGRFFFFSIAPKISVFLFGPRLGPVSVYSLGLFIGALFNLSNYYWTWLVHERDSFYIPNVLLNALAVSGGVAMYVMIRSILNLRLQLNLQTYAVN